VNALRVLVLLVFGLVVGQPSPASAWPIRSPPRLKIDTERESPRFQLGAAFVMGPFVRDSEEQCVRRDQASYCQGGGSFTGVGGTLELRVQLFRPIYLHTRGLVVGNAHPFPHQGYRAMGGVGLGLGLYIRYGFLRAEYLLLGSLSSRQTHAPFGARSVTADVHDLHSALVSGGFRLPVRKRWYGELWGGAVVGPRVEGATARDGSLAQSPLVSILVGFGAGFDLVRRAAR